MTGESDEPAVVRPDGREAVLREDEDPAFPFDLKTSRFECFVVLPEGELVESAPLPLPIDEAIAWGRRRAQRVTVLIGVDRWSAGPWNAGRLRPWPKNGAGVVRRTDLPPARTEGAIRALNRLRGKRPLQASGAAPDEAVPVDSKVGGAMHAGDDPGGGQYAEPSSSAEPLPDDVLILPGVHLRRGQPLRPGLTRRATAILSAFIALGGAAVLIAVLGSGGFEATPHGRSEAFVTEVHDPVDAGRVTGRFAVTLAELGEVGTSPGPSDVSITDALAWGRSHAMRVIVQAGDGARFSAGQTAAPGVATYPKAGIRFRPRFAYEPATGTLPTAWWVRLSFGRGYPSAEVIASVLRPQVRQLRIEQTGNNPVLSIKLPTTLTQSVLDTARTITHSLQDQPPDSVFARQLGKQTALQGGGITFDIAGSGAEPAAPPG